MPTSILVLASDRKAAGACSETALALRFHCVVVDGVLVATAALNADEAGVSLH